MASRIQERPREREQIPERERVREEELRLEPMLEDRDYEKLYGTRAWLRDRVRLAPVFAGLFIALATQVFLIAAGIAIGLVTAGAPGVEAVLGFATGTAIWVVISGWLSLLLGGWYAAHMAGVAGRIDGILNGVALWGLYITASLVLGGFTTLAGVGSLFTITIGASTIDLLQALNLSGTPTIAPDQALAIRSAVSAAAGALSFLVAIGAGFAILGAWLGHRSRQVRVHGRGPQPQGPRM